MMRQAAALFREQWRRNRFMILLSAGVILFFAVFYRILFLNTHPEGPALVLCWIPALYALLPLLSSLLFTENRVDGRSTGFPAHTFLLPVRTGLLIACPMVFAVCCVALWYLAWVLLVFRPIGMEASLGWPMGLLAAGTLCLQAVTWILGAFPIVRILASSVILAMLIAYGIFLSGLLQGTAFSTRVAAAAGIPLLLSIVIPAACVGVDRARSGQSVFPGRGMARGLRRCPDQRQAFSSASKAQLWLEWRQAGRLFPLYVTCYLGVLFLAGLSGMAPEQALLFDIFLLFLCPFLAPFLGPVHAGASMKKLDFHLTLFAATRPMSCEELAHLKLKAAGLSAVTAWALVSLFLPLWIIMTGQTEMVLDLFRRSTAVFGMQSTIAALVGSGMLLAGLSWILLSFTLSLALSGRRWLTAVVMISLAIPAAICLDGGIRLFRAQPPLHRLCGSVFPAAAVLAVFSILLTTACFVLARKRGRLSEQSLLKTLKLIGCLIPAVAFMIWELNPVPGASKTLIAAVLFLLSLGLLPVAAAPLALFWNRHR